MATLGGFQPTAFQPNCFQHSLVPASRFGYSIIIALSQTGIQAAQSAFLETDACLIEATFYDLQGLAFTPGALAYQVNDVGSGLTIVPLTTLLPAASVLVAVSSAQNALVTLTRYSEEHQVLFQIIDGFGDIHYARVVYDVIRAPGLPTGP